MTEARPFEILPAIDLREGRVVRLRQGDFARETAYDDEPATVAEEFVAAGARWLHVVDLDGARTGTPANGLAMAAIVGAVGERAHIEVAGGLRNELAVAEALGSGATRVVIGTAALEDPDVAGRLVETHGTGRIAVAIDVRDGRAVGHGWTGDAPGVDAADAIRRLSGVGIETFEVTAVERDGLMEGPNLALYERLVGLRCGAVIASGGVTSIEDVRAVRAIGCRGAIIGRALFEGRLDLREALALSETEG